MFVVSQYLGQELARLATERRRRFKAPKTPYFLLHLLWLIFCLLRHWSDGHYQFRLSVRSISDGAGKYLQVTQFKVIAVFWDAKTFVGVLTIRLLYRRFQRCWSRRFYDANEAIRSGYCLQQWEGSVAGWISKSKLPEAFLAWGTR